MKLSLISMNSAIKYTPWFTKAILIPTYNERDNITQLTLQLLSLVSPTTGIFIIDDSSPDGTGKLADRLASKYKQVVVLHRTEKKGLGAAYIHGLQELKKYPDVEYVLTMDADFSHDPRDVPRLFSLGKPKSIVFGSRYIKGGKTVQWGPRRKVISFVGRAIGRLLLGISIKDSTSGFRCYHRSFFNILDIQHISSQGYAFSIEITIHAQKLGFSLIETPITFTERRQGTSKLKAPSMVRFIREIIKVRIHINNELLSRSNSKE